MVNRCGVSFFSSLFFFLLVFLPFFFCFFCLMIRLRCLGLFHLLERDPSFRLGEYEKKDLALLRDRHVVHSIRLMDTVATLFHLPWMKKVAQMHTRKVYAESNSLVNPLTLDEGVRCLPERSDSILGEYSKESEHSRALSKQHRNRHPAVRVDVLPRRYRSRHRGTNYYQIRNRYVRGDEK